MSKKPLRFALAVTALCALILLVPFVAPHLMKGSKWDEPDVKPVWKIDEKKAWLTGLKWSNDERRLSYYVSNAAFYSRTPETVTYVERNWADGGEVSRRVVAQGLNADLWKIAIQNRPNWHSGGEQNRGDGLQTVLIRLPAVLRPYDRSQARGLEDILGFEKQMFEWRVFRVADEKLLTKKRFSNYASGRDERGMTWLGRLQNDVWFDGSALWFAVAPYRFPKNAEATLRQARDAQSRGDSTTAIRLTDSLHYGLQVNGDMALYDALSGRTRWFSSPSTKLVPGAEVQMEWNQVIFSPDHRLMTGKMTGFGINELKSSNALCVWDVKSRRLLWHHSHLESGDQMADVKFSPDGKKIAGLNPNNDGLRSSVAIQVFDARTGKALGAPLFEESPRQRSEAARARWQRPFQNGAERVTRAFASGTPTPAPRGPGDGFFHYEWAPDSRHILAFHGGSELKLWRVP